MKPRFLIATIATVLVAGLFLACSNKQEKLEGGVFVETSLTDLGLCPFWAVNGAGIPDVTELRFTSVLKHPTLDDRYLDVRFDDLWTTWRRVDGGTRLPQPYHIAFPFLVPAGTETKLDGIPFMGLQQLSEGPFDSLFPVNGGVDLETGTKMIRLDTTLSFYGKTYTGDNIKTSVRIIEEFWYGYGCNL